MKDVDVTGLKKVDTQERNHWRAALRDYTSLHPPEGGKQTLNLDSSGSSDSIYVL